MHKYYRTKDVDKAVKIAQRAKEAETYVVWGRKYKSVSMIANEYGIKRSTIFKKMEQGNTLEEALTEILKKEVIFFQGKEFHGLTELSCYYGQDVSLVWERLAYGIFKKCVRVLFIYGGVWADQVFKGFKLQSSDGGDKCGNQKDDPITDF